jgi:hypothetical protein
VDARRPPKRVLAAHLPISLRTSIDTAGGRFGRGELSKPKTVETPCGATRRRCPV